MPSGSRKRSWTWVALGALALGILAVDALMLAGLFLRGALGTRNLKPAQQKVSLNRGRTMMCTHHNKDPPKDMNVGQPCRQQDFDLFV